MDNWKGGTEVKKVMLDRMANNCCPICGAAVTEESKSVFDEHIALQGEPIKICKTHNAQI